MSKTKWLKAFLVLSLISNFLLGAMYFRFANQSKNALISLSNFTLMNIKRIIYSDSDPVTEWESKIQRIELYHSMEKAHAFAHTAASFSSPKNKNYSEIKDALGKLAFILNDLMEKVKVLSDNPFSEAEKQMLMDLKTNLANAGFKEQAQQNNGENFKNSLNNFLDNYE